MTLHLGGGVLTLKKLFTQTEKQRIFVENRGVYNHTVERSKLRPSIYGARVIECSQNVIEERRLERSLHAIDKARNKTVSQINGEKHLLQITYRELLKTTDTRLTDPLVLQPGFRFHNNGDIRIPKKSLTISPVELNTIPYYNYVPSVIRGKSDSLMSVYNGDPLKVNNYLSDFKSLQHMNGVGSQDNVRSKSFSFKPDSADGAMGKEAKSKGMQSLSLPLQPFSPKDIAKLQSQDGRTSPRPTQESPRLQNVNAIIRQKKHEKKHFADRFSRTCTRSTCKACEHRLIHKPTLEGPMYKASVPPRRWNSAPRGVYVKKLTDVSIPGKSHSFSGQTKVSKRTKEKGSDNSDNASKNKQGNTPQKRKNTVIGSPPKSAPAKNIPRLAQYVKSTEDAYRAVQSNAMRSNRKSVQISDLLPVVIVEEADAKGPNDKSSVAVHTKSVDDATGKKLSAGSIGLPFSRAESIAMMKKKAHHQNLAAASRVMDFMLELPVPKPSIARWRSTDPSSGKLQWKTLNSDGQLPKQPSSTQSPRLGPEEGANSHFLRKAEGGVKTKRTSPRRTPTPSDVGDQDLDSPTSPYSSYEDEDADDADRSSSGSSMEHEHVLRTRFMSLGVPSSEGLHAWHP